MGKTVLKRRFLDTWHIGETESWLTDMAAQGLHLVDLGTIFVRFERGEPENIRYRVDFTQADGYAMEEQLTLYAENGWEFVSDLAEVRIFRSPDALNAPELHTDPAEQAIVLHRRHRKLLVQTVLSVLLLIGMLALHFSFSRETTLSLVEGRLVRSSYPVYLLFNMHAIIFSTGALISAGTLIKSMREGRAMNHHADWKRLRRYWRISKIITNLLVIIGTVLFFAPSLPRTEELPLIDTNPMYLRLADIEMDTALVRDTVINIDGVVRSNVVMREWSPYTSLMFSITENGVIPGRMWSDGSGKYSPNLYVKVYRLRFSRMIDGLLDDLCDRYAEYISGTVQERPGASGFDRLFMRIRNDFYQEVFASHGNTVVYVLYRGEEDIDTVIEAVRLWLEGM